MQTKKKKMAHELYKGGGGVPCRSFLTLTLDEGELSTSLSNYHTSQKQPPILTLIMTVTIIRNAKK
jgi:hypothetical protein